MRERRERTGIAPVEFPAIRNRQRFRQHEIAVQQIEHRQTSGDEEWQSQIHRAEQAADDRSHDEADAEHRAQHAESFRAQLRGRDVSDVRVTHRRIGLHHAAHQSRDNQHPECRRERRGEKRDGQSAEAEQQHWPTPVFI